MITNVTNPTTWSNASYVSPTHTLSDPGTYRYSNIGINGISSNITKETQMSTLDKIKQQRQEERERGRIERMYAEYDDLDLEATEGGVVWAVEVDEQAQAMVAHYDGLWSITGGPFHATLEDVIAYLIRHDVEASALS